MKSFLAQIVSITIALCFVALSVLAIPTSEKRKGMCNYSFHSIQILMQLIASIFEAHNPADDSQTEKRRRLSLYNSNPPVYQSIWKRLNTQQGDSCTYKREDYSKYDKFRMCMLKYVNHEVPPLGSPDSYALWFTPIVQALSREIQDEIWKTASEPFFLKTAELWNCIRYAGARDIIDMKETTRLVAMHCTIKGRGNIKHQHAMLYYLLRTSKLTRDHKNFYFMRSISSGMVGASVLLMLQEDVQFDMRNMLWASFAGVNDELLKILYSKDLLRNLLECGSDTTADLMPLPDPLTPVTETATMLSNSFQKGAPFMIKTWIDKCQLQWDDIVTVEDYGGKSFTMPFYQQVIRKRSKTLFHVLCNAITKKFGTLGEKLEEILGQLMTTAIKLKAAPLISAAGLRILRLYNTCETDEISACPLPRFLTLDALSGMIPIVQAVDENLKQEYGGEYITTLLETVDVKFPNYLDSIFKETNPRRLIQALTLGNELVYWFSRPARSPPVSAIN
jgi:hypothetical protein